MSRRTRFNSATARFIVIAPAGARTRLAAAVAQFKGLTMTQGTYAGLRAVFVRHYAGNMIEIRVPGGLIVVDRKDFLL